MIQLKTTAEGRKKLSTQMVECPTDNWLYDASMMSHAQVQNLLDDIDTLLAREARLVAQIKEAREILADQGLWVTIENVDAPPQRTRLRGEVMKEIELLEQIKKCARIRWSEYGGDATLVWDEERVLGLLLKHRAQSTESEVK